jgi:leader peptidase (prepilin peptidase)/N-methyltransferase
MSVVCAVMAAAGGGRPELLVWLLPGADGSWRTALLGSLTLGACYLVVFLINPRGFGFGVGLILARRAGRKTSIPFGSFLLAGAFIGILVSSRAL